MHEWKYNLKDRPKLSVDPDGNLKYEGEEPLRKDLLTTWIFDEGSFAPTAKLVGDKQYSIITDYLGTPVEAYDVSGKKVWECQLDVYGKVRNCVGGVSFIPFRYQGQMHDVETGLYYNRFRYYDPEIGNYVSQDPIGLAGGSRLYEYSKNVTLIFDPFGLLDFYHATSSPGATEGVLNGIDLSKNRPNLDFNPAGQSGFYVTNDLAQANTWASNGGSVIHFDIPEEELAKLNMKVFDGPTDEWGEFVKQGRAGTLKHNYDAVEGPMIALGKSKNMGKSMPVLLPPDKRIGHQLAIFTDNLAFADFASQKKE